MTNTIEQAKREFYSKLAGYKLYSVTLGVLEQSLESYLELLRQDHEALQEAWKKAARENQDLIQQVIAMRANRDELARSNLEKIDAYKSMKQERDDIQLRLHAVDHAYKTQQDQVGTSGQVSGDRASCEATEANAEVIRAAVRSIQLVITDWGMGDRKAKKAMRQIARIVNGDGKVADACGSLEKDRYKLDEKSLKMRAMLDAVDQHKRGTCMHSFFAIGQDQMKCTFCGVGK